VLFLLTKIHQISRADVARHTPTMSNQTPLQPPQSAITPAASSLSQAARSAASTAAAAFTGAVSNAQSIVTSLNFSSPAYRGANRPLWQKRSCCCSNPELCKKLMWEWSMLGEDYAHMLEYAAIPPLKTGEKVTTQNEHANGYHKVCVLHLHGRDKQINDEFATNDHKVFIAPHHFKPCLRGALARSTKEKSNIKKFRCSKQEAKDALLTAADLCKVRAKGDNVQIYYISPNNINFDDIKHELSEAKAKARIKLDAANASSKKKKLGSNTSAAVAPRRVDFTSPSATSSVEEKLRTKYNQPTSINVSRTGKRSPIERDFDNMCNEFKETPEKYVLEMNELKQQLAKMEKELEDVKVTKNKEVAELQLENEELRKEFEKQIRTTGLTRKSILSPEWHNKNPHMSNYLVGFEKWDHFKSFAKAVFAVDVDITGESKIQPFEKVCMCAMMIRRAFRRPSLGGIYDRTPAAITGYLQEWIPIFGLVGWWLSELSFEKTHNFIDEETARELKTKYIYPDGTVVDFSEIESKLS
jgi:hypothetical protein